MCHRLTLTFCFGLTLLVARIYSAKAMEQTWKLDFLIVDESGSPLPKVQIKVAYLKNDDPNVKETPSNWFKFIVTTNGQTDSNGLCTFSGKGTTDMWQCFFEKPGFSQKRKSYSGPANLTGFSGPGAAQQMHTEMLVRTNADIMTWPKFGVRFNVVDDADAPLKDASATLYYSTESDFGNSVETNATGLTDSNGVFMASVRPTSGLMAMIVKKDGYYESREGLELGDREDYDPVKWNPTLSFLLKKIIKPIPMYARWVNLGMPVFDQPAGFDLMNGDWIAPYGKGSNSDLYFTAHLIKTNGESDYTLTVSFPNPGDGIQEFKMPATRISQGSTLRSSQAAPPNGYSPKWVQYDKRRPGKPIATNRDENRNFYFRIRTVLDKDSNIVSANYGKIYGDFMQFRYFLNPTPNDRNVEFDPRHNLFPAKKRGGVSVGGP